MTPTIEELARGLGWTHKRLAMKLSRRWVKGTGFCHASVGRDLEALGIAESRMAYGRYREIRATPLGLTLRAYLEKTHG